MRPVLATESSFPVDVRDGQELHRGAFGEAVACGGHAERRSRSRGAGVSIKVPDHQESHCHSHHETDHALAHVGQANPTCGKTDC